MPPSPSPHPLSVAIVCKNNESTIGRVLLSVRELVGDRGSGPGEIVAVDSGSTDGTLGLLEQHGARVVKAQWRGHIATKQMAMDLCERPWVLCLDSDEPPEPDLCRSILQAIERDDPMIGGYRVNRKIWYRGRFLDHAWQPEWRLRLVRRGAARWGGDDPHDKLELIDASLRTGDLVGTLRHDSFESFAHQLQKQVALARISAQVLHKKGERSGPVRAVVSGVGAVLKQAVVKGAWRDGAAGWLAALTTGAYHLTKHTVLYELSSQRADKPERNDGAGER
ncbi:MAG: glycosyltransferase family 2 protein [Planctomycetota bacterium]